MQMDQSEAIHNRKYCFKWYFGLEFGEGKLKLKFQGAIETSFVFYSPSTIQQSSRGSLARLGWSHNFEDLEDLPGSNKKLKV